MRVWKTLIICCLTLSLLLSFGAGTGFAEGEQDTAAAQSKTEEPERLSEVVESRTKNSKTYQLSDGTFEWVGYTEDIHYEDTDGKLKEINNAIKDKPAKEGYAYGNTENAWHAYFADSLCKKNAVVLEKDKYTLSFSMADAQISSKAAKSNALDKSKSTFDEMLAEDNRAVVYKDVLKNVDVAYTVRTNVLKEDIILRTASAPNVFEFDVTAEGLTILEKEGTVFFVNSEGQEVFNLAPMYMEDANGKYSDKVDCTIEENEGGYRITITADKEFLNASDTQYPVIVDPDYMVTGSSVTFDSCVDQQYPNSNYYLSQNLWTGGELGTNAMRTFIKFTLPTDIPSASVTNAYLRIKKNAYSTPTIKAYRVTTPEWTSSEITYNNQPQWTTLYGSEEAYNDSGYWYRLNNVKIIVNYWLAGTCYNYGFVLKEPTETDTNQKTRFYSSDAPSPNKPELHIVYNDTVYTISYNGNGNTGGSAPASQSVYADQSIALRTNTGNLTKTGCTLLGWNTNSAGTGINYSLGETIIAPASNFTLYARWSSPVYYTISYNGNYNTGGTVPESQSVPMGESIALSMNTGNLTKTRCTLLGWNTNSGGTGVDYSLGQTITPTSDLTLYAKWGISQVRLFYYDSGLPTNIPTIRGWFENAGYDASSYYCTPADAVRSYIGQSKIVHIEGHGASENGGAIWCTTTTILSATGNFTGIYPLSEAYSSGALQGCDFIFFAGCYTARSDPEFGDLDDYACYTLGVGSTLAFEDEVQYTGNGDPNYGAEKFIKSFYDHMLNDEKTVREAAALARDESILLWEDWGLDSYIYHNGDLTF